MCRNQPAPSHSAGNALSQVSPSETPSCTSEGVATPGRIGMPRSCAARTTTGSIPGETRYAAPASSPRVDLLGA